MGGGDSWEWYVVLRWMYRALMGVERGDLFGANDEVLKWCLGEVRYKKSDGPYWQR